MKGRECEDLRRSTLQHNIDSFKAGAYSFFTFSNPKKKYNNAQTNAFESIFKDHKTLIGYGGGMGGGKSWVVSIILALCCGAFPNTTWLLARRTLIDLKKTTLMSFFEVCDYLGFENGVDYQYNERANLITFLKTGARICLYGLNFKKESKQYHLLKNTLLTGAFIDEGHECFDSLVDVVRDRVGRKNNCRYNIPPFIFETFTFKRGRILDQYITPFLTRAIPSNTAVIRASYKDNPFLAYEYVEALKCLC